MLHRGHRIGGSAAAGSGDRHQTWDILDVKTAHWLKSQGELTDIWIECSQESGTGSESRERVRICDAPQRRQRQRSRESG
jgi:hypothetical protein